MHRIYNPTIFDNILGTDGTLNPLSPFTMLAEMFRS